MDAAVQRLRISRAHVTKRRHNANECHVCQAFAYNDPISWECTFTIAELKETRVNNCPLCKILLAFSRGFEEEWGPKEDQWPGRPLTIRVFRYQQGNPIRISGVFAKDAILFGVPAALEQIIEGSPERRAQENHDGDSHSKILHDVLSTPGFFGESIESRLKKAREWLELCEASHGSSCQLNPITPKRLLRVVRGASGAYVELVNGSEIGATARYACLSYCWGVSPSPHEPSSGSKNGEETPQEPSSDSISSKRASLSQWLRRHGRRGKELLSSGQETETASIIQQHGSFQQGPPLAKRTVSHTSRRYVLSQQTLATLQSGMRLEDLPRTIQDAILVVSGLGIDYLWIDALCIFQDSLGDWSHESNQMSQIYGGSTITVSATSSASADDGFLEQCSLGDTGLKVSDKEVTGLDLHIKPAYDHSEWTDSVEAELTSKPSAKSLPLHGRAWTLQESLLPSRIISFGAREIKFECNRMTRCECSEMDSGPRSGTRYLPSKWELEKLADPSAEKKLPHFRAYWRRTIVDYSRRAITNDDDRGIALAGIVRRLEPVWGKCFSGHWEIDLIDSLLWKSYCGHCRRPPHIRAPTWSWLSLEYPRGLSYANDGDRKESSFGQDSILYHTGTLTVTAPVIDLVLAPKPNPMAGEPVLGYWAYPERAFDPWVTYAGRSRQEEGTPAQINLRTRDTTGMDWKCNVSLDLEGRSGTTIVCLKLKGRCYTGLLCNRVDEQTNTYERVGLWTGYRIPAVEDEDVRQYSAPAARTVVLI